MFPLVMYYLELSTVMGLQSECEGKAREGDLYRLNTIALYSVK